MFDLFRSKKNELVTPITGKIIPIEEVNDAVFRDKVLGDGVAIIPTENSVYAPCSGTIVQIAHTLHAICIESEDGLEVLLHLGMDTVKLEGRGFTSFISVGQKVSQGDKIMEMDIAYVLEQGYQIQSPCIITNMSDIKKIEFFKGDGVHGTTPIMRYQKA